MLRALTALGGLLALLPAANAMVGGAQLAAQAIARHVVLIVSANGACSGVAIAPDLVLTAAHCVLKGGKFRIAAFDGNRPAIKPVQSVAAHPQFGPRDNAPDVALIKLAPNPPPNLLPVPLQRPARTDLGRRPLHCRRIWRLDAGRPPHRRQAAIRNPGRHRQTKHPDRQPDRPADAG